MNLEARLQERRRVIGVLYAEDFDVEDVPEPDPEPDFLAPEPEFIEPLFTAAELDTARAEGQATGQLEAERSLAASRLQILEQIVAGLAEADHAAAAVAEAAAAGVARSLLAALAACLPSLCERHGATELQALMRSLLPSLASQPRITVRVHPQMVAAVMAEMTALDAEIAERMVLLPNDAIPPGDARVTWEDGTALRDTGRARTALNESLAALGLLEEELTDG